MEREMGQQPNSEGHLTGASVQGPKVQSWIAVEVGVSDMGPNGVPVYAVFTDDSQRCIADAVLEKDAKLIAAAPDLLSALRDLLTFAQPHFSDETQRAVTENARAAIARATGA